MNSEIKSAATHTPAPLPGIPGHKVVIVMFGFGFLAVAALFTYWEAYTGPFRPLQTAIAAQFPASSPRVIGGRHKSHKQGSPRVLRIISRVPFDPNSMNQQADERVESLTAIADENADLSEYDQIEVHLYQRVPEESTNFRKTVVPLTHNESD